MTPDTPTLTPTSLPTPPPSVTLPAPLEALWLTFAQKETRAASDRDALQRLLPDIIRLADRFTTGRPAPAIAETPVPPPSPAEAPAPYLRTTRECLAYTLYFAPQSYARTTQMAAALPKRFPAPPPPHAAPLRILSLGAGTGGDLFAWLDALSTPRPASAARPLQATALDHSRAALRILHETFTALRPSRWPGATLRTRPEPLSAFLDAPCEPVDILSIHYLLNELPPAQRRQLLSKAARSLAPGGWLILCDPLLRAEGDPYRDLRAWAIDALSPLTLRAPCPHLAACPLSEPCHAVRTWTLPRTLQILNVTLRRDLRHLAYTWLAFQNAPPSSGPSPAWTTASAQNQKGHTQVTVCAADAQLHTLRLLHRHLTAAQRKTLRHLERGIPLPL